MDNGAVYSDMSEWKPGEATAIHRRENLERPCVRGFPPFRGENRNGKVHRGKIMVSLHDLHTTLAHECHAFVRIPPIPDNVPQAIDFVNF